MTPAFPVRSQDASAMPTVGNAEASVGSGAADVARGTTAGKTYTFCMYFLR